MAKIPSQISKFLPRRNRFIGLDIGSSSIKLAEFAFQGGKATLAKLKLEEIDLQKDTQIAQLEALKKLFQGINTEKTKVNVVINCSRSTTRILTIPYSPKSEIPDLLKWEMKNSVSFSIDEAMLDYEVIAEVVEKGVKKLKVACVCTPQETINSYLGLLIQAGVKPNLFTQAGFALKNVIATIVGEENKAIAVLDIGANFSEFFIFQGQELAFNRKLPVAGESFTQDMSQVLVSELGKTQLVPQEAENIKRKYGLPDSADSKVIEGKLTSAQLLSLLRPNLEKLATEVERSFDFYREKQQGAGIERLILLGGGSNLGGLAKNLGQSLDISVELGNPLRGLALSEPSLLKDKSESAHRFAQAIGAAFSPPDSLNLLPVEIKEQAQLLVKRSSLQALTTAIIVILILIYMGMRISLGVYAQRIAAAKLELNALFSQAGEVQKKALLNSALKKRIYWSDVLKEIGNRIPEQIRLTEMRSQEQSLTLKGEIKSLALAEEKVLTEFMDALGKGIFKEVKLVTTKKGVAASQPYTFEIKLSLAQ